MRVVDQSSGCLVAAREVVSMPVVLVVSSLVAGLASMGRTHAQHRGGVLVLDCILGSLHLLLLDEFIVLVSARSPVVGIRIIPGMGLITRALFRRRKAWRLLLRVLVADVHHVALVHHCVVRAAVRPDLVVRVSPHLSLILRAARAASN